MDLSTVRGNYVDLELNLDLIVHSRAGDGEVAVYSRYTDAQACITYDTGERRRGASGLCEQQLQWQCQVYE